MASPVESLMPVASQSYASQILVAPVCAWALQLIIGSVATMRACDTLTGAGGLGKRRSSVPYAREMLITAVTCNVAGILVCFWQLADFATRQDRSLATLASPRLCRTVAPIPIGLTAAVTQLFMASRCWRLANRSIPFGIVVVLLISLGCGSALTFGGMMIAHTPLTNFGTLFCAQLFSWSSLSVDTIITAVLVYNLYKKKQDGQPSEAESLLNSLIRIAFETCSIVWFVVFIGSICGAVAFRYVAVRSTFWALCAVTPSLYLLSFVYCLEATTNHIQPGQHSSDLSQAEGAAQCLCAQVRPFVMELKRDDTSGSSVDDTTPVSPVSWSAPQEWGNSKNYENIFLPTLAAQSETARRGSIIPPDMDTIHRASIISLPASFRNQRRMSMPRTRGCGVATVSVMEHV